MDCLSRYGWTVNAHAEIGGESMEHLAAGNSRKLHDQVI